MNKYIYDTLKLMKKWGTKRSIQYLLPSTSTFVTIILLGVLIFTFPENEWSQFNRESAGKLITTSSTPSELPEEKPPVVPPATVTVTETPQQKPSQADTTYGRTLRTSTQNTQLSTEEMYDNNYHNHNENNTKGYTESYLPERTSTDNQRWGEHNESTISDTTSNTESSVPHTEDYDNGNSITVNTAPSRIQQQ